MIGNSIATLYGKANNGPLGAAISIAMMLVITLVVCAFLGLIGPRRLKRLRG
jgi:spermidine/putrescine transport system permease protein